MKKIILGISVFGLLFFPEIKAENVENNIKSEPIQNQISKEISQNQSQENIEKISDENKITLVGLLDEFLQNLNENIEASETTLEELRTEQQKFAEKIKTEQDINQLAIDANLLKDKISNFRKILEGQQEEFHQIKTKISKLKLEKSIKDYGKKLTQLSKMVTNLNMMQSQIGAKQLEEDNFRQSSDIPSEPQSKEPQNAENNSTAETNLEENNPDFQNDEIQIKENNSAEESTIENSTLEKKGKKKLNKKGPKSKKIKSAENGKNDVLNANLEKKSAKKTKKSKKFEKKSQKKQKSGEKVENKNA